MKSSGFRWLRVALAAGLVGTALAVATLATGNPAPRSAGGNAGGDSPAFLPGTYPKALEAGRVEELLQRDDAFMSRRTAGDVRLDGNEAGKLRAEGGKAAWSHRNDRRVVSDPATFSSAWRGLGANPVVQVTRSGPGSFAGMSGRIGALAIRPSNGKFILGAAQGGIWLYDSVNGVWVPKTDNLPSLAIGALAIAPTNDAIVYAGTGEGALSGDSYFGNGIIKSTDGGEHWANVSGDYFEGVAVSNLVVDPANANHLFASVLRGRGGARRTTPAIHSRFGIWESNDGGVTWKLLKEATSESNGATDVELDPQNTQILYASFWGDAMYKSTDGGASWAPIMNGLPAGADFAGAQTRFSIAISHPAGQSAVLYSGFDYRDAAGAHPSRVWKSTDQGASWQLLPAGSGDDSVTDYCGGQCFYDNVIEADPTNPNVVFAAGQFAYNLGSGGVFRSDDGGQTWKNLGWDQHPDFHALVFDRSNTNHVLVGSDGGVWFSPDKGGRPNASDPLSAVTWQNLNGTVDPNTSAVLHRTNLAITQFTSIANSPSTPTGADGERYWGGTQDNGTLRKSVNSQSWFDVASGDGGQVLVDPGDGNFVYGTYFGISPYRYTNGGATFFSNQTITQGINLGDRSDFYIPFTLNQLNTNQLFLGTYRLYRTDSAKAASSGDVLWKPVSPDLTGGCTGTAPNGARTCAISAIGVGGGTAVYTGSLDGFVYMSPNAQVSNDPTWFRLDSKGKQLPNRPVSQFAVDRSNYRIAYVAYSGFNDATPQHSGHVFRTLDGGVSWVNISGNLPDVPVNSVILDPSYSHTLYVGTDIGPFVTNNGGANWTALGTGIPPVAIWQLDLDPAHRLLAAGTHGRGAWSIKDAATVPALVLSKIDAGKPVGPASHLDYTLTLRNIGNAAATGVTIFDPIPLNTSFVSAQDGGKGNRAFVSWTGLTVPAGGAVSVHFTVSISEALRKNVESIVNDGFAATSAEGMSATGSPTVTPIAPPFAVALSPATQTDGGRNGTSVKYHVTVQNNGFQPDTYALSAASTYAVHFLDSACALPASSVSVPSGASADVCISVDVPASAPNAEVNTATVTARSSGSPTVTASGTVKTIAVSVDTLLVDNDDNNPDVQGIYKTALTTAGLTYSVWDLKADAALPTNYVKAFKSVYWFTGNSYPGPILPYEATLKSFLDGGGRLFVSGQDLLDQAAGTTTFVHDYLHVTWDGTETQNDKPTANVHGVAGSPVTNGIGTVPLDHSVLGAAFEDRVTPNGGALVAFTDDTAQANGLSFSGTYKVVFLAFPLESYGTAVQKADLITRVSTFFG
jgi:photosystem II stability/assembly factor-like uncharacterized protein